MSTNLPPAAVRRAHTVGLVQAAVCGVAAAIVLALTLATYTSDNAPDGKTLGDVAGPVALEAGAVLLALAVGLTAQLFRGGSEVARLALVVLEIVVGLAGVALGVVSLQYGLAGGGGVWLVVLVPAALAVAALLGRESRGWCREPASPNL